MSDQKCLFDYLTSKTVQYNDNKGYRQCLRELFNMNPATYSEKIDLIKSTEELDAETEDEISYDCEAAEKIMDDIFLKTVGDEIMDHIYSCAAARMFSEDKSIGLAVLFSYDYLPCFYLCLVDYLKAPGEFNKSNINYINLMKKIS
jgi:hypothetical protein